MTHSYTTSGDLTLEPSGVILWLLRFCGNDHSSRVISAGVTRGSRYPFSSERAMFRIGGKQENVLNGIINEYSFGRTFRNGI